MKHNITLAFVALLVFGAATCQPARAEQPMDAIKSATDKILNILTSEDYQGKANEEKRENAIRQAVDERFDWNAMSRRALGRHWRKFNDQQQQRFLELFGELLETRYMDQVEGYSGEDVQYKNERVDGNYSQVDVAIITDKGKEIAVQYRMHQSDAEWLVYDVVIEGVSLVMNYRSQFNSILARSTPDELLDKIQKKVDKQS